MEDFMDHIDHIAKTVGVEHVGIGTDWPMSLPEWGVQMLAEKIAPEMGFRPEDRISTETLVGFEDYRAFINITRGLVSRGYSDAEISAILGGNWLRVMEGVWK
jgi:membrane dipeptidase